MAHGFIHLSPAALPEAAESHSASSDCPAVAFPNNEAGAEEQKAVRCLCQVEQQRPAAPPEYCEVITLKTDVLAFVPQDLIAKTAENG